MRTYIVCVQQDKLYDNIAENYIQLFSVFKFDSKKRRECIQTPEENTTKNELQESRFGVLSKVNCASIKQAEGQQAGNGISRRHI